MARQRAGGAIDPVGRVPRERLPRASKAEERPAVGARRAPASSERASRTSPSTSARAAAGRCSAASRTPASSSTSCTASTTRRVRARGHLRWPFATILAGRRDGARAGARGRSRAGRERRASLLGRRLRPRRRGRPAARRPDRVPRPAHRRGDRARAANGCRASEIFARTGHPVPAVQHALPARRPRARRPARRRARRC